MPKLEIKQPAGVVGLGLMGTSISACLLAAGHAVSAVEHEPSTRRTARIRLLALLREARNEGLLRSDPADLLGRFHVSADYSALDGSGVVIESVVEDLRVKRRVIRSVEAAVSHDTLIGSNTSAIPVTLLQQGARYPQRIVGIHWGEPAHIMPFMEITCGNRTSKDSARRAMALARAWGKQPSLLRRDIRGFITNRVMYAMIREACHLVESGVATVADVDRSVRNDLGYWLAFAGPFRFMDLTGIRAYAAVMRDLLPELSRQTRVPRLVRDIVRTGARGVSNARGFYEYNSAQARRWEKMYRKFSYEIRALAQKYAGGAENGAALGRSARRTGRTKNAQI